MSFYSAGIRVFLLVLVTTFFVVATVNATDPKVVNVSHQPGAKPVADETAEPEEDGISYSPQWPEPPNMGAMLLKLSIGTVVVLGLCVAVLWFGKPWLQKFQVAGTGNSALQVEGSVAIGNRAMLYLVRIGDTQLIAGTDVSGLKSLIALPPTFKEVLDEQVPEVQPSPVSTPVAFNLRAVKRPDSKE